MRLHELSLTGYIGIYNGMGLENIYIPFYDCKFPITVIRGDNGSGKSTIYKALTPFADPSNSFIPNKPAKKLISYMMGDGDLITIRYLHEVSSSGERKQAKCYISRTIPNGITTELNPNGNITDGKAIINDIFDFDTTFVSLSHLSSEDRGIADKKPAERKKLLNSIIDSISVYNDVYKNLSKQSSALKSMITSINNKIATIGDVTYIEARIKQLEEEQLRLENRVSECLLESGKLMTIVDKADSEGLPDKYDKTRNEYNNLYQILEGIPYMSDTDYEKATKKLEEYDKEISKYESELNKLKGSEDTLTPILSRIYAEKDTALIEYNRYRDSNDEFHKLISSIEILEGDLKPLKERYKEYEKLCSSISPETYRILKSIVVDINNKLQEISSYEAPNAYKLRQLTTYEVVNNVSHELPMEDIGDMRVRLANMLSEYKMQLRLKEVIDKSPKIPDGCKLYKTCELASSILERNSEYIGDEKLSELDLAIRELEGKVEEQINIQNSRKAIEYMSSRMRSIRNDLMLHGKLLRYFGIDDLREKYILGEATSIGFDDSSYNEGMNLKTLIDDKTAELDRVRSLISKLNASEEDLNKLKKAYQEKDEQYALYVNDLANIHKNKGEIEADKAYTEKLRADIAEEIRLHNHVVEIKTKITGLVSDIKSMKARMEEYREASSTIEKYKNEIENINLNMLPGVINEVNKLKYDLVLYNDYLKEYNEFSQKFNVVEVVKKHTSPTTGIQTVFMNMYMNDIVMISNQLLGMMFGGEYVLHPFIINENEFRIPCSGSGILNDDVSSMSNAQICMISLIISFALLHKSSSVYNIIRLDEIDAALDHQNRIMFRDLLMRIMAIINARQCIMISHNSEFDLNTCDVIILRSSDPNLKIEGNVIFKV